MVLGCTHYPLLSGVIAEVMGPDVRLVDSAESVAAEVRQLLNENAKLAAERRESNAAHRFFVTDVPEPFQIVAERFLGRKVERLVQARIEGE